MTGARLPYLERRQGMWNLRVRVPDGIKLRVGMREVRRSLRTYSPERARLLAAPLIAQLQEIFRMAQAEIATKEQVRKLVEGCFDKLRDETENHAPVFDDFAREIHEQRRMVEERLDDLRAQVRAGEFEAHIEETASRLLRERGYDVGALSPGLRRDLVEGVARAMAEQQRLYDFRLGDRLRPYEPQDPIFQSKQDSYAPLAMLPPGAGKIGPTVQEAVDRYLKAKRRSWTAKTLDNRRRQLALLVDHLGPDRRLRSVTPDDIRTYRDGVLRFRRDHHVGASLTFIGRQVENASLRIEPKTALLHVDRARTFLRWAVADGYLDADPSANITVELPKKAKTVKPRRKFTPTELETLFSAPMFTGCKSLGRRHAPGAVVIRDAQFWLPLLGYHTGARMGELIQLHMADVHVDEAVPYISITDAESGEVGTGTEKHVKSSAGVRLVPIHPHLIDLGFGDFVAKRKADKRRWVRLFYEIEFGRDGQASSPYSKRFARLLDNLGLTDPTICFHSFRHGVEDALRDIEKPQYVIDRIIGHAEGTVSGDYGDGASLDTVAKAVAAMKLPVDARTFISA